MAWLAAQLRAQTDRLTLWAPVALGCGAGVYFALPKEPFTWTAGLVALASAGLWAAARWASGRRWAFVGLILLSVALAGFALAKLRTQRVAAPVAIESGRPQLVEGWVVDVASPGRGGPRVLIAPIRVGDWSAAETPVRIRMTLRALADVPPPGRAMRLLAIINPPPPPASPGSYDFARDAFFESVGGVGFALRPPVAVTADPPPWRLGLTMRVNAARWALAERIVAIMGVETGGLAAAMTTGQEAFIPQQQVDDLRAAGLAHIISISGLHMAIVGGFAFALVRLVGAAWPWLALRVPGKKLAALAGLAAVSGYLVMSGAPPPATRAAITAGVAFFAMLIDRQAISLHALAIAALAILVVQPEAVTEPGFQMSFAATAALVALAEAWTRPAREIDVPWPIRAVQALGAWIVLSLAVSFVAGLATGPFALQHFNRVSTWGLFANLAVAPISSFVMMPALAIGAALAPLGLGDWPLKVAGLGISAMLSVARITAGAPNASLLFASAPAWALPASFLGLLWLCLWKGRLRWLGLPLALAVQFAPRPPAPDAWVAADGSAAAVRSGTRAVLLRPDVKLFAAELWARRRGLEPQGDAVIRDQMFDCDRWSCAPLKGALTPVAVIWSLRPVKPERLAALCANAELVVTRGGLDPAVCPQARVLQAADFARGGALETRREPAGWTLVWAQDLRGRRPWSWNWGR
ncbi:MAG: ComEC/Rec2 family competence protein [Phenylobacterium sp.]|uniref:ComEC/Rec2 family competence protein n=1 Tax=Phenylobacterium sp. TaxID=1871053 RepID=UPI0027358A8F|nr:ComEC/Rec2 family competence protein [Phenylobacterium sp.]MDP3175080.1 ComEC/Rec2 family competence protein [Phenylobacterium sp.]